MFKIVKNPQEIIYEKLLLFLNCKPMLSNLGHYSAEENGEYWCSFGRGSDKSNVLCTFNAFMMVANYTDRPAELAKGSVTSYLRTLFLWAVAYGAP